MCQIARFEYLLPMEKYKKFHIKIIIPRPTWDEEFELPDWSYSVSYIQDYFEYINKKHETFYKWPTNPNIC